MTADAQPSPDRLAARFRERDARVGVVGLGYVGLPLVLEYGSRGFRVVGFDIDPAKVEALAKGRSYISHIPASRIAQLCASGRFEPTADFSRVRECDAVLLCVPTPLTPNRDPDLQFVEGTARAIAPHLRAGQLVVLESTTYPGTTEEVLVPLLEKGSGLRAGVDLHVAYSPEREDPNNRQYTTATIPKVVGGLTPGCRTVAEALYSTVVERVVPVSSCAVAEASKLVENIFRSVNIAMVNELKVVFDRMGIDIWEVIEAAKTKPFGYMPFYPGPGLGGHCIPIDPFYLSWKARAHGMPTRFIELAGEINSRMPHHVVNRTVEGLNAQGKALRGSRVLLVGIAYKNDVDDTRESPGLELMDLFETWGATVDYHDPHIPELPPTRKHARLAGRRSVKLPPAEPYDAAVISTAHSSVDYHALARHARLVVDTRNAMAGVETGETPVVKA